MAVIVKSETMFGIKDTCIFRGMFAVIEFGCILGDQDDLFFADAIYSCITMRLQNLMRLDLFVIEKLVRSLGFTPTLAARIDASCRIGSQPFNQKLRAIVQAFVSKVHSVEF